MSYCKFCETKEPQDINRLYHDTQYGFPIDSDDELFGRLILEINQAGLSWQTILKKQANFRKAFNDFSVEKIANYNQEKIDELLQNSGIIRNKLKITAAIHNAKVVISLQKEHVSFKKWLEINSPKTREEWVKLFKKDFKFVGGEIINEFLMSAGYLKGAHDETCNIFNVVLLSDPNWKKCENR
jgi:DNA-3-methyladenine glycosylase I